MSVLYVDRKQVQIRAESGTLRVRDPGGKSATVPLAHLERVVVRGDASLSASAIGAITDSGAGLVILSGRQNRHLATCVGAPHKDVLRRLGQFDAYRDTPTRNEWSRKVVHAKLHAQLRVLSEAKLRRADKRLVLHKSIRQIEALSARVSEHGGFSVATCLGIEGAAASAYFGGYKTLFPPSLNFAGRRKRPPPDPVNACLSLAYTLLHFEAVNCAHEVGLDPMLGLFHEPSYGRASLASDAIEPFRPHIDAWVWEMFRERHLTVDHFSNAKDGILLGKAGRRHFYDKFRPLGTALRRLLRRQLGAAAKSFEQRGRNISGE